MQHQTPQQGDIFLNNTTGTKNQIIHIEQNHWYPGSHSYGPFYTLLILGTDKHIQLTPAMLGRFTKLNSL